MPLIFGSPEAKTILAADRELYGDSRYPGDESAPAMPCMWKITTSLTTFAERTYYVEALTEADAREAISLGHDYDDQYGVGDLGDEVIESVEKVEK